MNFEICIVRGILLNLIFDKFDKNMIYSLNGLVNLHSNLQFKDYSDLL